MKKIIIINGGGGVGKDTFVKYCGEYAMVVNYSSVDEIKTAAKMLGWSGGKKENDRQFLANLKLLSAQYNDFPFKCICKNIENFLQGQDELMFIHIRNIDEIERVIKKYPFIQTLLITNSRIKPITTNIADANVDQYQYDIYLKNEGDLFDLKNNANSFIQQIRSNKDK